MNQPRLSQSITKIARIALGLDELAELHGNSVGFWRKQIREGRLRATRLGRRVVVTTDDLENYLERCKEIRAVK
jgi:excisionase family DNA binding protein